MKKIIMICDKCESEFDERVPHGDPKKSKMDCRRDSRISFKSGQIGLDFCLKCEEIVTVAEARRIAANKFHKIYP